jgi:hypothetical protein
MKETRNFKLPIIGRVQHGEQIVNDNGKKQVKEYKYFIAKVKEPNMQHYLEKFNKLIKGKKNIDIQFLDDNPLTVRYERNNQGGRACYCMENEETGKQKVKNLWQPIKCTADCQYLKRDSNDKKACNRIAWLKFFIPEISTDRLWLMKITSQEAIDNLKGYIAMQKLQGNSLKGTYTIFLYDAEQIDRQGKIHNNCLVDIVEKNIATQNTIPQISQNVEHHQTIQAEVKETTLSKNKDTVKESKKSNTRKSTSKTAAESTSKKAEKEETKSVSENNTKDISTAENLQSKETTGDYAFISTYEEIVKTAKGEKKYVVGEFVDMDDKIHNIYVKHEFANELRQCDIGTMVKLTVQEKADRKFAMDIMYIIKMQKKDVA